MLEKDNETLQGRMSELQKFLNVSSSAGIIPESVASEISKRLQVDRRPQMKQSQRRCFQHLKGQRVHLMLASGLDPRAEATILPSLLHTSVIPSTRT